MATQRLRWAIPRICNPAFYRKLNAQLKNPLAFYRILFLKIVPGLHKRAMVLELRDGKTIRVRSFMTLYIFEEIFLDEVYDVKSHDVTSLVDIGANTGLFLLWAKRRWPQAKVIAFEPEPGNYAALCETISNNGLEGVTAIKAAVAPKQGTVKLYRHPRNVGGHSIVHQFSDDSFDVQCQTIADALAQLPDGRCDFMKMDCEGAEEPILRNLDQGLAEKIETIVYEPNVYESVNSLNERLTTLGFTIAAYKGNYVAQRHNERPL
jgi:FkbM family methyltransferase